MDQSVYGGSQIVSAAVLSGQLILGLADGKVIDCGRVQGPQGLRGDRGPIGATGSPGVDGNTILSGKGPPRADLGKDGDFYINNRDWFVFGPKSGGMWGAGQGMLPKDIPAVTPGGTSSPSVGGSGGGNGGGSIGTIYTQNVILTDPTRNTINTKTGYRVLPDPGTGNNTQRDANQWAFGQAFDSIDAAIPVPTGELPPSPLPGYIDIYEGRLWFKTTDDENRLYIYDDGDWVPCTSEVVIVSEDKPDSGNEGDLWWDSSENELTLYIYYDGNWVPASPPVSLDGIENSITNIEEELDNVYSQVNATKLDVFQTASDLNFAVEETKKDQERQDNQIIELEEEIESLAPSLDRGKWNLASLGAGVTLASGEYAMGIGVDSVYCQSKYLECVENANNDPYEMSECTRLMGVCEDAKDNGEEFFINDWEHASFLHFHKTDSEGKTHTFSDYKVGMFIDLFDQGDTGYAVFEITAEATLDGDVYTIAVNPVQHEGEAAGLARVKVFGLSGADATDFVRKTGDTMTGSLEIDKNLTVHNRTNFNEKVRINLDPEDGGSSSFVIYGKVDNQDEQLLLRSTFHDKYSRTNDKVEYYGLTDTNLSLVNKQYVDNQINNLFESLIGAEYEFRYTNATPAEGSHLVMNDESSGQIKPGNTLIFSYSPANRPLMKHSSVDGWVQNFGDNKPLLSIFSINEGSRVALCTAPVTKIEYSIQYFKVTLGFWVEKGDQITSFTNYRFNIPGFL